MFIKKLPTYPALILLFFWCYVTVVSCSAPHPTEVVALNEKAYAFRYRNLDSTTFYAQKALKLSKTRSGDYAEALNNLAFVSLAKMQYQQVDSLLSLIFQNTNNQIEQLIADVQMMRLCQRCSENKNFYVYRERAIRRFKRIKEESANLSDHQELRMIYAESEFNITNSTYFYYVGLENESVEAINVIDVNGDITQDTTQLLNYLYNVGAGGVILNGTREEINQAEFDYLIRCYQLSKQFHYPYWEANSLQAISERLQRKKYRDKLIHDNLPSFQYLNPYHMPDSLLAGHLAQRALDKFQKYGDVYQTAGTYRTLAQCYWELHDYPSALICLTNALNTNQAILQAPDLVASIREQLSLVYSAMNDKQKSDYNRNLYLDIQEGTRQDRQLEARAEQLNQSLRILNQMIVAIVLMIVFVSFLLWMFDWMRKCNEKRTSVLEKLLEPLEEWKIENEKFLSTYQERYEEMEERKEMTEVRLSQNKRRNLEQRAKLSLVQIVLPLIDRILHEVHRLCDRQENSQIRAERYTYIAELTDQINQYNAVLTNWIQLRKGYLSLKIESFPLQDLLDILKRNRMSFRLKGIELNIQDTDAVVKADKTLTLFMLNTLCDNARKFTPSGGKVRVYANNERDFVEIVIEDTGIGMTSEQLQHLFDHKPIVDSAAPDSASLQKHNSRVSHGFGLMNCKGIIDRYKKISKIFDVCTIQAESEYQKGSKFLFRLPKGVVRLLLTVVLLGCQLAIPLFAKQLVASAHSSSHGNASMKINKDATSMASVFADSVYQSNINGTFHKTLIYADSCISYLNKMYLAQYPQKADTMVLITGSTALPAEIQWLHQHVSMPYNLILSMRNEVAVAALGLKYWNLYSYNNQVYIQLFRERSADNTLSTYVKMMQKSESNKNIAIALLSFIFLLIFPAYYFLYYRHRIYYQFCVHKIDNINQVLLGEDSAKNKLAKINKLWASNKQIFNPQFSRLNAIVAQIQSALKQRIQTEEVQVHQMEILEDDLHRSDYENSQLYISNSVLDNCLSTLKHETMYYPSKIKLLVEKKDENLAPLKEISTYYRDLFKILSAQAMRQVDNTSRVDDELLQYLFDMLQQQNKAKPIMQIHQRDETYTFIDLTMQNLQLSDEALSALFTPDTHDMQFWLCRQIIRELGEATNARACGIEARRLADGYVHIFITITNQTWKNLKLL